MITAITFDDISPMYLSQSKLKKLLDFLKDLDVNCTLFVIPKECHDYASKGFLSVLKTALDSGHELALHGYTHAKNEFGVFYSFPLPIPFPPLKRQIENIKKGTEIFQNLLEVKPQGFRAPYYLHNINTMKALSYLNFKYDSSATIFKPTHNFNFRIRWLQDPRPFIINNVVELPVAGDYTYNIEHRTFLDSMKRVMWDFELLKSYNGIYVINNHPGPRFQEREFQFLKSFIRKIGDKTAFLRLVDVAENLCKMANSDKADTDDIDEKRVFNREILEY